MELIQLIIVLGLAFFSFIQQKGKQEKKKTATGSRNILSEVFPELASEEKKKTPLTSPQPLRRLQSKEKKKDHKPAPMLHTKPIQTAHATQKAESIRLNSREKARKAFLYSEIFNRKY